MSVHKIESLQKTYESVHFETNLMKFAPSLELDQTGHLQFSNKHLKAGYYNGYPAKRH